MPRRKKSDRGIYVLNSARRKGWTHTHTRVRNRIKSFSKGNLSGPENLCASEEVRAVLLSARCLFPKWTHVAPLQWLVMEIFLVESVRSPDTLCRAYMVLKAVNAAPESMQSNGFDGFVHTKILAKDTLH
jgi:hypothetical protein